LIAVEMEKYALHFAIEKKNSFRPLTPLPICLFSPLLECTTFFYRINDSDLMKYKYDYGHFFAVVRGFKADKTN
jgi:hypothetical protein